ncbi:DUF2520 domain-containing protein [Neolewinella aurantiaca]|nr:DUF2520 domain-containing protein [Neolewinella aurantiaca]
MQEILVIGAGNLSWHLVQVLQQAEYDVTLVTRNPDRVADWPVRIQPLSEISFVPDLVVLAVPDDAIHQASTELANYFSPEVPVIHTSGATPTAMINSHFAHRGALWPIRSLRAGEPVTDWKELPLVYHATDPALTQVLAELTAKLSDETHLLDDAQRAKLHLAAVFSNNFVTWLYEISHQLCTESDIPFSVLLPIIRNTALKQDGVAPRLSQTGAAARGDQATMNRHLHLLASHPEYQQLYQEFSRMISAGIDR